MRSISASTYEHTAGRTRRKWGEIRRSESIVVFAPLKIPGTAKACTLTQSRGWLRSAVLSLVAWCCPKSSVGADFRFRQGILLTVRHGLAFSPGRGVKDDLQ